MNVVFESVFHLPIYSSVMFNFYPFHIMMIKEWIINIWLDECISKWIYKIMGQEVILKINYSVNVTVNKANLLVLSSLYLLFPSKYLHLGKKSSNYMQNSWMNERIIQWIFQWLNYWVKSQWTKAMNENIIKQFNNFFINGSKSSIYPIENFFNFAYSILKLFFIDPRLDFFDYASF